MGRFQAKAFFTELQRQLHREAAAALATMEVVGDGEEPHFGNEPNFRHEDDLQVTPDDNPTDLTFGPYSVSPISGLHFDAADDTAAS